jgi:hypothetical protein
MNENNPGKGKEKLNRGMLNILEIHPKITTFGRF